MLPLTSTLPPIRKIASTDDLELRGAIDYIRKIYNPPVRGSRRRRRRSAANGCSGTHIPNDEQGDLEALRRDAFERTYSTTWLTHLVSHFSIFGDDEDQNPHSLLNDAAGLLAIVAGTASAGIITRLFTVPSAYGPVSVQLRDVPLDNQDYGSVGAQTWGGACIMAEMIAEDPGRFDLILSSSGSPGPYRVLELGAGTGLVSLAIAQLYRKMIGEVSRRGDPVIDIVATDYYPSVLENLRVNVTENRLEDAKSTSPAVRLRTWPLDWSKFPSTTALPPLDKPFDVIFGADIVYEEQHAIWIMDCLKKLLKRGSWFHLIIPLRHTHTFESCTIEVVFARPLAACGEPSLIWHSKDIITCDADSGRDGDEVDYACYKIGWS
ncbi:hypothetical protein FA15DRAFT_670215 [Coprinopsis marcescibilis]|uniref:S-adenosyl-L-methionine-dependent methyltransferase n=1 Tax=Coprinopsis marcescibilis TaxID=230819 RepID=A0A5C3KTH9_COPMA|nr:hypothetical protein FA15DRAFT_670215 [Coprinopsis marcescibilis]